jgi:hypothetical protein
MYYWVFMVSSLYRVVVAAAQNESNRGGKCSGGRAGVAPGRLGNFYVPISGF